MSAASPSENKRAAKLNKARETLWDIVVVGGGITGAGVAREASRRGLRVLLLEQQDFSWGTSSRSSKMVHGGLRYLAMGDRKLTKESLLERERLIKEAPDLVRRMGYYFLLPKGWLPWRLVMKFLLSSYDRIAGIKNHKLCDLPELNQAFTGINDQNISGAAYYTDAVTDDSRLVLRVLQEAEADGACLLNYCTVSDCIPAAGQSTDSESTDPINTDLKTSDLKNTDLKNTDLKDTDLKDTDLKNTNLKDSDSKNASYQTLKVIDSCGSGEFVCQARVVVNSTGAWADKLRQQRIDEKRVRPLKGSHIVLKKGVLPIESALSCQHPEDKRSVFVFPWEGHSVIGTTDLDYDKNIDEVASISSAELDYLLKIVNHNFPKNTVARQDIVSTWSGVRPVIAGDKQFKEQRQSSSSGARKKPSKERRDHAVWDNKGLISAAGGKLTTFRVMALDVLEKSQAYLPTWDFHRDDEAVFRPVPPCDFTSIAGVQLSNAQQQQLLGCYGFRSADFMAQASGPELSHFVADKYCMAQLRWALKHEWVEHLDDLLLRRTRLGLLLENGAEQLFEDCRQLCQQELSWSDDRWFAELKRYQQIWETSYSLPKVSGDE